MHRTLESFRELKSKGDDHLRLLSKQGITGIHLCGDDDLTEILTFCFTGLMIELLSVIPEKNLINELEQNFEIKMPELKPGELIMIASLENRNLIKEFLIKEGLKKNKQWILFS